MYMYIYSWAESLSLPKPPIAPNLFQSHRKQHPSNALLQNPHPCMCVCMHMYLYITCTYLCICMYVYVYIYICVYVCMYA